MTGPETIQMPALGQQGDACAECGAELATDQRYCLNCGRRRTGPRIASVPDYILATSGGGAGTAGAAPQQAAAAAPRRELSPLWTATALAALGVMLLIGVLIGRGDGDSPEPAATPAVVTVGETPAETTEDAGSQTASAAPAKKGAKNAKSGGGEVKGPQASSLTSGEAAKSGETVVASEEALEELQNTTGAAYEEAQKKLPDKIATPGKLPPQDPGGEAGGGSNATVIK
jgi:hypothetical protein